MARQQRIQVDSTGLPAPVVQPTAAPVDTYRGPGTAGVQLAQLARGLSSLVPGVEQFAQTVGQKQATDEQQKAAMDVQREHFQKNKSYAKAIKDGDIPPTASPYYMQSFKERYGRVTADGFQSFLQGRIEANKDLSTAVDPAQAGNLFDHVAQQAMNEYLKDQADGAVGDQGFHVGFDNRAAAYIASEKKAYIDSLTSRVKKLSDDLVFQEIHHGLLDSFSRHADPAQMIADANATMDDAISKGQDGTAVAHATIDAFAASALADPLHGFQILDMIKELKGGSGSLGDTRYALATIDKVKQELSKRHTAEQLAAQRAVDQDREQRATKAYSDAFDYIKNNPGNSTGLLEIAASVKDVPRAFDTILSLREQFGKLKYADDPDTKHELGVGIWDNPPTTDRQRVAASLKANKITLSTAIELMNQIQMRHHIDGTGPEGDGIGNPRLKDSFHKAYSDLRRSLGDNPFGSVLGKDVPKIRDGSAMFQQWFYHAVETGSVPQNPDDWEPWLRKKSEEIRTFEMGDAADMSPNPTPTPRFEMTPEEMDKRFPKDPVLSPADILSGSRGVSTPNLTRWLNKLGIAFMSDTAARFLNSQTDLLKKQIKKSQKKE